MNAKLRSRLETAERRAGTTPPPPPRRPKPTTSEGREVVRAFVREFIATDPGGIVDLEIVALLRRQEEQRARGFRVDPDPTIAAIVQSISDGFVGEPDQGAIVAAIEAWFAGQPEGGP